MCTFHITHTVLLRTTRKYIHSNFAITQLRTLTTNGAVTGIALHITCTRCLLCDPAAKAVRDESWRRPREEQTLKQNITFYQTKLNMPDSVSSTVDAPRWALHDPNQTYALPMAIRGERHHPPYATLH